MSELLPCPFCGGSDIDSHFAAGSDKDNNSTQGVGCMNCGGCSDMKVTEEEAIKAWNTRTPHEELGRRAREMVNSSYNAFELGKQVFWLVKELFPTKPLDEGENGSNRNTDNLEG